MKQDKWITDIHTHSTFSYDGVDELKDMLDAAQKEGVDFYGVSEHFDYDVCKQAQKECPQTIDEEAYFHAARHLQEDYAGVVNVLIGAEFGYTENKTAHADYAKVCQKYRPDFIVNSVHTYQGVDYYFQKPYYDVTENGERKLRAKQEVYKAYLSTVRNSLEAPYPYDIVGHIGYAARYAPYQDKEMEYEAFAKEFDEILRAIIKKDKILEVNAASRELKGESVPPRRVLERYYELGGKKISYASDAHQTKSIIRKREAIVQMLKEIGFTYLTVPCRGEHIKVEL